MHAPAAPAAPRVVGVEMSALRDGARSASSFLEFVLAALAADGAATTAPWAIGGRRSSVPQGARGDRRARAWLVRALGVLGVTASSRMVAPRCDLLHLASGPLALRLEPPVVVTVHGVDETLRRPATRAAHRRAEGLRQAARHGAVIHAVTDQVAEHLVEALGLPASSIIVAHPGIGVVVAGAHDRAGGVLAVDIVPGGEPRLAGAVAAALRAAGGVEPRLVDPRHAAGGDCVVVVAPDDGFPVVALEAMAAGRPVVTSRNATTTSLLSGAARFVEEVSPEAFARSAIVVGSMGEERTICVTAGLARAGDFAVHRRSGDLMALYARARAAT